YFVARSFIGERLALVGDAAHVIHPIAGQGLNMGRKDAAALAEVIVDAARLGIDHGQADVLERYQRWRRFDTVAMGVA
ncbi:FAD-dependent monooxygenase, partial [Klebsiella pneumoniae]|nr:FAD-dependent monooxygenase [Klebsiella pneumoniae]